VSAEALRGGGGADSFVQFPLEKSSRKVYNYGNCNTNFTPKAYESSWVAIGWLRPFLYKKFYIIIISRLGYNMNV